MLRGRSRGQATSALALAAVVLYAGAQVASLVHRAAVVHVVCVEHGRLEHLETSPGAGGVAASGERSVRASALTPVARAHAHDACAAVALGRTPLPIAAAPLVGSAQTERRAPAQAAREPGSRRLRLLLAPKSSPPATARAFA